MAETTALINSVGPTELGQESDSAIFHRKIEFHQARKPLGGLGDTCSKGFKLVTLNPTSKPHVASGLGKKSEKSSEFSETGLDSELTFEISFRRIGAGLRNLGNTCFLNSVLQCLTYTEPLAAYLHSGKHQSYCRAAGFCALCAIQKHVIRALQSTGRILEPKDLVSNLRRISRNFGNYRQEDAHEYMVYLLESMHKCCLPSGVPSESPSAYEKSLVHKIFGGRLRSQVKCTECSYCSNKFDPFLDLSLEIAQADSLHKALDHFTAEEQLDGGAKEYQCQQCNQKVEARKQLTIHKAPHVLTVHLKRFRAYAPSQKIDRKVAFEPTLDLKPFVSGPCDGGLNYTLYGVLVHAGWSTRSGHYYCFVRTSSGMWYSLNDNQVAQVNERTVLAQKAYMLFYVRDRTKSCARKPVDVMQKKTRANNGIGDAAYLKLNLELRDTILHDPNEKKLNGFSSVALLESDAAVAAPPAMTPSELISSPNTKTVMAIDNLSLKRDSESEHLSVVTPTNDLLEERPVLDINSVGHKVEPSGFMDNGKENSSELAGKTSKTDYTNFEMCASKTMPDEAIHTPSNQADVVSQENNIEDSLVGDSLVKTVVSTLEETCQNEPKMDDAQSKELLGLQELLAHRITKKRRPTCKVRRKLFKCRLGTTSISSNIILGVDPCVRKRKRKQRKHMSVQMFLDVKVSPSKQEQFIPEEVFLDNVSHNEFTGRFIQDGTTVSAEKQPQITHSAAQGSANSEEHQRELRQIDVMSVLTRGLDEITVARWDEIDVSLTQKSESVAGTAHIGYVGDEWDEEYDRGKRKKIRGPTISFGGPNLFQEIAMENSKRRRAKMEGSRLANQPFRI